MTRRRSGCAASASPASSRSSSNATSRSRRRSAPGAGAGGRSASAPRRRSWGWRAGSCRAWPRRPAGRRSAGGPARPAGWSGRGLGEVLRRIGAWRGPLVLTFHRVGDPRGSPLDPAPFSATAEEFEAHVAHLADATDAVGLDDVPRALRARRVLVTFDDGYRDAYEVAFPILRA